MIEIYFFDSSALVKRYVTETGSTWVQKITDPQAGYRVILARITWVEVLSALARLQREGNLLTTDVEQTIQTFRYDWDTQYQVVELDQLLVEAAGQLVQSHPLRAYDSVQLASALKIHAAFAPLTTVTVHFVSADQRQLAAAQSRGLETLNPNTAQ